MVGYGQVMFWMVASERQTHRIRKHFYENVMRQNIGWFDVNESNELNSRLTKYVVLYCIDSLIVLVGYYISCFMFCYMARYLFQKNSSKTKFKINKVAVK